MGMSQLFCKKKFCFRPCNKSFSRPSLFDKDDWISATTLTSRLVNQAQMLKTIPSQTISLNLTLSIKFNKNNHYLENYAFGQTASRFLKAFTRKWHFTFKLFLAIKGKTVSVGGGGGRKVWEREVKSPPPHPPPRPFVKKMWRRPLYLKNKRKVEKMKNLEFQLEPSSTCYDVSK